MVQLQPDLPSRVLQRKINNQGREFANEVLAAFHKLTEVEKCISSVYYPQANRLVNTINHNPETTQSQRRKLAQSSPRHPDGIQDIQEGKHWIQSILSDAWQRIQAACPLMVWWYLNEIGCSCPSHPWWSRPRWCQGPPGSHQQPQGYPGDIVQGNIQKAHDKQKRDYKKRNKKKEAFKKRSTILLWNQQRADLKGVKMTDPWMGPYCHTWCHDMTSQDTMSCGVTSWRRVTSHDMTWHDVT